jgi:hypothetical protein
MDGLHRILVVTLMAAFAGCSTPAKTPPPGDAGGADAASHDDRGRDLGDDAPIGTQRLPEIDDGIYAGWATDNAARDATMGLWSETSVRAGRLVLDGTDAFSLHLSDARRTLSVIDAACEGCAVGTEWQLDITRDDGDIRLTVVGADDEPLPGFTGLVMVPHDGFKPEQAPDPDSRVWAGPVLAVSPVIENAPALDANCELSVSRETDEITFFGCRGVDLESPWTAIVSDSWREDADGASFVVDSESVRLGYRGHFVETEQATFLKGSILRLGPGGEPSDDSEVIGAFSFELISPSQ